MSSFNTSQKHPRFASKILSIFVLSCFLLNSVSITSFAAGATPPFQSKIYTPTLMQGLNVYPKDPFKLRFFFNETKTQNFNQEANKLVKYFLASLAVSEKDLWVNLNPAEKNRIIPDTFGKTEMGKELLA